MVRGGGRVFALALAVPGDLTPGTDPLSSWWQGFGPALGGVANARSSGQRQGRTVSVWPFTPYPAWYEGDTSPPCTQERA